MPQLENFRFPSPTDRGERQLLSDVSGYGWHIVSVEPDPGMIASPFAYSVGLFYTLGHPEIVITGLRQRTAGRVINNIGSRVKAGETFKPSTPYEGLIENYKVLFRAVSETAYPQYLGYAMWFYRCISSQFPTLQMLWPDRSGKFPGTTEFDQALRLVQFIVEG
jgi:hypothetical protein